MTTYTTKEAADILGVLPRTIQKKCKAQKIRKKDNKYLITDEHINEWSEQTNEPEELIYEEFTPEHYAKLQEVLGDYPKLLESLQDHRNQIDYLKKSLDKAHSQMDVLLNSINKSLQAIQQGNYLMAKKEQDRDQ